MKITLFTSNKIRHNYLINLMSEVSDQLFVIQECDTDLQGVENKIHQTPQILKKYFDYVNNAQLQLFSNPSFTNNKKKNIKFLSISAGDLNKCSMHSLTNFLKSDIYIIFGSSYIKGELVEFLVKKKAINIHAGVSPFYRGSACNFWALYDNNPHLVGSTIHLLSKGLDSGPILYHAMSNLKTDPFEYTMSTVKSAFHSIVERIKDGSIFKIKPITQDKKKELRYSKKNEFNEEIVKNYFEKEINLNKKFDKSLLKDPFFYFIS
tara:strand:+ start:2875 stop:3666 length:792 start_codon:yes stop_codon:yes gene_type:complete